MKQFKVVFILVFGAALFTQAQTGTFCYDQDFGPIALVQEICSDTFKLKIDSIDTSEVANLPVNGATAVAHHTTYFATDTAEILTDGTYVYPSPIALQADYPASDSNAITKATSPRGHSANVLSAKNSNVLKVGTRP